MGSGQPAGSHLGLASALKGFSEIEDIKGDGAFRSAGKNTDVPANVTWMKDEPPPLDTQDVQQLFQSLMEKQVLIPADQ